MGYADISKRRRTVAPKAPPVKVEQKKREVVRFEVGKIYNSDERVVCLGRFTDDKGVERVKFYSVSDARDDLKECGEVLDFSCEKCAVRIFNGVERATQCEDADDIEDYDIRADRTCGEMRLSDDSFVSVKPKKRKSKKSNPIAGLITIAVIILLIRACTSV